MTNAHKYEVVVGNVGTVHTGNLRNLAVVSYSTGVELSTAKCGRTMGEPVTLFEDGEPIMEHRGYQYVYEDYSRDELQTLLSCLRSEDRSHCPVCGHVVYAVDLRHAKYVDYDKGADHRVQVPRTCDGCGFAWADVYRTVGGELYP